jgi:hypothetical protein
VTLDFPIDFDSMPTADDRRARGRRGLGKLERVENYVALDVIALARAGALVPGARSEMPLGVSGRAMEVTTAESGDVISVRSQGWCDAHIQLTTTACNFGGTRFWFLCPVLGCGSRVGKLYKVPDGWGCRTCTNLRYQSQLQNLATRRMARALAIRRRLNGVSDGRPPLLPRPSGMRETTYERLSAEVHEAEAQYFEGLDVFIERMERLVSQFQKPNEASAARRAAPDTRA